ncbi:hypothetical protein [Novosphingobium profundi]|uniref:hypothetical protein n=1 Tax=Novosphingobium profundi TaxID=1774954 RepID=UPI001CFDDE65|nr:hypothetical protein [Novosphingobium profundi]
MLTFLHGLVATGSVAQAARRAGMSRQSAYRLRARSGEGFAQSWDEGIALGQRMRACGMEVPPLAAMFARGHNAVEQGDR